MKRILRAIAYSMYFIFSVAILLAAFEYGRTKYAIAQLPFSQIVGMCSGQTTMEATCECFNYYGRHCLSSKRLVWDWVPTDGDPDASEATPLKLEDLIERELTEETQEDT